MQNVQTPKILVVAEVKVPGDYDKCNHCSGGTL